ncbi:uncharacterized protein LOC126909228 [Daktulosphaira vitifoliae]|uniref:uncharacterized protein LOC126909228 n=1 Tax=Daktulosphaira vitifoliae TaxID=58002 RepID=UPI0021AACDCB|nr:uncharacterized protein LOC126909228 [Daktulosphaira vitifoliae]
MNEDFKKMLGRCGFTANSTEWFYPTLLITFSLMIPWSISFYFVFISRPSSATIRATRGLLNSSDLIRSQPEDLPSKWIFSLYTVFVTPGYLSSCSFLYKTQDENIWIENKKYDSILDGYLSKLPIIFDLIVPLVLIYYHKAFRKKCRDLYLHGFRNSVSDGSQMMKKRISNRRIKEDKLINDSPVLFLENSGIISLRIPKDNGFIITACDVDEDGNSVNKKKRVSKAIGSNSKNINENEEFQNEESQF